MICPSHQQYAQPRGGETPLWAPLYGATLPQPVQRFFKKYATFSGRASRSEYWWWVLVSAGVSIVLQIIMYGAGAAGGQSDVYGNTTVGPGMGVLVLWGLATIVPSLALTGPPRQRPLGHAPRRYHLHAGSGPEGPVGCQTIQRPAIQRRGFRTGPRPSKRARR